MTTRIDVKHLLAGAALAAAFLPAGCAMFAPKAERYVAPPQGATWVTGRRDTGSYGAGSTQIPGKRGEQTWQGRQVISFESAEATTLALPNGDWVALVRGATPVLTWDPPLSYDWPLEVGKSWTREQKVTVHATKQTMAYRLTQKVEAYEDVSVPAGVFKAFRITTSDTQGNENTNWFAPELGIFVKGSARRTASHAQGAGTRETELLSQTIRR